MSIFTLASSYLTSSNLPWFMDLTFQVPMQHCSLQHWTLLPSPVTSTTRCCFCFSSVSSFFLELFLHWSPVAYWAPTDLGSFIFHCPIFLPFHTTHGVLKARILKWFAIAFSRGPRFVRTLLHDPSWVALHGMAHSFIELDKAVVHVISLISFLWWWFSFLSALWWIRIKAYRSVLMGETECGVNWALFWWVGPCLITSIQFSVDNLW